MEPQRLDDRPSRITVGMADVAMAIFIIVLGAVVIYDSLRIGAGWAEDGPQSGYFPFFIGSVLLLSGVVVLFHTITHWVEHRAWFATHRQLWYVFSVLVPSCAYVAAIYLLGIYVSSALYIGWFMVRYGKFGWRLSAAVSMGVPIALFLLFDKWFLVPLPKGPLEHLLGY